MDRSFVFIMAMDHNKDYSAADRYGDLVAIADQERVAPDGTIQPGYVTFAEHTDKRLMSRLRRIVDRYNPDRDYILPTGSPTFIGIVCGMVARKHGRIRLLKWDRVNRMYDAMVIDYQKLEQPDEE